jgi:hypothetical protein
MPWALPETDEARLALAKGYPYAAPRISFLFRDGEVRPLDEADFSARTPVLAHGSNRAPEQLRRKFGGRPGAEVPVTYLRLSDYDVVYSAHVTRYGAVASTLVHVPGCRVRVALTWLTDDQLRRMHETEGASYPFGRLRGIGMEVEAGPPVPAGVGLYVSRHGCIAESGRPIGLAAVEAENRPHAAVAQEGILRLVCERSGSGSDLDSHILATVADADFRAGVMVSLARDALAASVPHFIPAA